MTKIVITVKIIVFHQNFTLEKQIFLHEQFMLNPDKFYSAVNITKYTITATIRLTA